MYKGIKSILILIIINTFYMWKLISESNSTSVKIEGKLYQAVGLKQFYYINNKGEVKYENSLGESKILTIGDGLWVSEEGTVNEIKILGIRQNIYKLVYNCFGGIIQKNYQIHHIDYNRNNNNINNLICITAKEHRDIHRPLACYICANIITRIKNYNSKNIKKEYNNYIAAHNSYAKLSKHIGKYDEYYYKWQLYLIEQINKYKELKRTEYLNKLTKQKLNTISKNNKLLENERKAKLDSGEYYINENGKLIKKIRNKWTEERRNKTLNTRLTSDKWKNMGNKVSKTLKQKWQDDEFREYMISLYNK